MPRQHAGARCLYAGAITSVILAMLCLEPASSSADTLRCPEVLAVTANTELYKEWSVYTNEPLFLTDAHVLINSPWLDDTGLLDPDKVEKLNDAGLTEVSTYYLNHEPGSTLSLACYYGGFHAQLTRELPRMYSSCKFYKRQFIERNFEVICH